MHDVFDVQQQTTAQRTAGMRTRKVFFGKAARFEHSDR